MTTTMGRRGCFLETRRRSTTKRPQVHALMKVSTLVALGGGCNADTSLLFFPSFLSLSLSLTRAHIHTHVLSLSLCGIYLPTYVYLSPSLSLARHRRMIHRELVGTSWSSSQTQHHMHAHMHIHIRWDRDTHSPRRGTSSSSVLETRHEKIVANARVSR